MNDPRKIPSATSRKLAVLALIAMTATWGLLFAPVKVVISTTPVAGFLLLRFIYALCFLLPLVWWQRRRRIPARRRTIDAMAGWVYGVATGVVLFLVYYLQTAGLAHTTSGKTGFITGLTVVLIPMIAAMVEWKRPALAIFLSGLLALAGLAGASMDTLQNGEMMHISQGDLLVLAAAFFNALHIVLTAKGVHRTDGPAFTTVQVCVAAVLAWLLLPGELAALANYPWSVHLLAFGSGFYAIGVLLLLQTWAQGIVAPFSVGMIFNLEPLFAVTGGVLMLGEMASGQQMAGFAVMLAAILWAQLMDKPAMPRTTPGYT